MIEHLQQIARGDDVALFFVGLVIVLMVLAALAALDGFFAGVRRVNHDDKDEPITGYSDPGVFPRSREFGG